MSLIISALDFDDLGKAQELVKTLKSEIAYFKIGFQLFTRYGPKAVEMVRNEDGEVFLDLKIHDIPKITAAVTQFAASAECYAMTVHVQSGEEAMRAAKRSQVNGLPHLWGVTVLSSIEDGDSVSRAAVAYNCGFEGVIVSGNDVENVRNRFPELEIVTPGIRPAGYGKKDDQKRILTPADAAGKGADFLVIGRPIIESDDPLNTVRQIKKEIEKL